MKCKRTAAFLTAMLLFASAVGCTKETADNKNSSGDNSGKKSGKTSSALNVSLDHSYSSEKITIDGAENVRFNTMTEFGDNILFSGYTADKGETVMYLYHTNDGSSQPVQLNYPSTLEENTDYYIVSSFVDAEQHPVFLYCAYSWNEEDEENPYSDLGYTMETYDADLNLIETKDMSEVLSSEENSFQRILIDGQGNIFTIVVDTMTGSEKLLIYDKDFHQKGEVTGDFQYIENMFLGKDGKLIVNYQDIDWKGCYGTVDPETGTLNKIEIKDAPQWFNVSFAGKSGYDIYLCNATAAYGVNLETGTCEEAINWINSDFMGDSVGNVLQLNDGRFIMISNDYSHDELTSEIWILKERDPEELKNVQLITLATLYISSDLSKAINEFNRTNSEYRIGVMNYDQFNTEEDYEAGQTKFENDMTSGIMADIINLSGLPYESYANKGLFMDLSEKISELNPDEYFMNFFDSLRYGDKLYRMGFSFYIQTLEAKTKHVDGKSGLSLSEFTDLMKNLPGDMKAFEEMSKDSALSQLCTSNLNSFIDVSTGTCHFDSPEFVELLELCNTYPKSEDIDMDRNDWTDEQWNQYWMDQNYQYLNDKVLFRPVYISDVKNMLMERATYFDKEDVTLVGYPTASENSNGGRINPNFTIAIASNSAYQSQAWDFCKSLLTEEAQEELSWSLPVRREAFDKIAEKAIKPDTYIDEEGNEVEVPYTFYRGEEEITVPTPTQEDVDKIKAYLESVTESSYYNEQVYNIVYEEASKYFAGDQTSQAAADMIQSRASLYLSEQT